LDWSADNGATWPGTKSPGGGIGGVGSRGTAKDPQILGPKAGNTHLLKPLGA